MLDGLLKSADGSLQDLLANKGENPDSAGSVKETVLRVIQQQATTGNFDALMEMFSGRETDPDGPAVNQLKGDVVSGLSEKLGIDSQKALSIATAVLPMLLNLFNKKVNDAPQANDEIQKSVVESVKGEDKTRLGGILGSIFGTDENPGAIDLGSMIDLGKGFFDKR